MNAAIVIILLVNIAAAGVAWTKGKRWMALIGAFLFAPVAWVGAIRLAKPGTAWFDNYPYAKRRLAWERSPAAWERFENTSFEIAA